MKAPALSNVEYATRARMLNARILYLLRRLKTGRGCQAVLIGEIVKAANARPQRREGLRIQGWTVVEVAS